MSCALCEVHPAGHSSALNSLAGFRSDGVCRQDDHTVSTRRERPQSDSHSPGPCRMESNRNRLAKRSSRPPAAAVWVGRRVPFEVSDEPAGFVERQHEVQPAVRDARSGDVGSAGADVAALCGGVVDNAVIRKGERGYPESDRARHNRRDTAASRKRAPPARQPSATARLNIGHRHHPGSHPLQALGPNALWSERTATLGANATDEFASLKRDCRKDRPAAAVLTALL